MLYFLKRKEGPLVVNKHGWHINIRYFFITDITDTRVKVLGSFLHRSEDIGIFYKTFTRYAFPEMLYPYIKSEPRGWLPTK